MVVIAPAKVQSGIERPSVTNITRLEKLMEGFEPDFEFVPAPRISEEEFDTRIERIRREATVNGYDATLVHADIGGHFLHH